MEPTYLDLEEVLTAFRNKTYRPKGTWTAIRDYALPVFDNYDAIAEAKQIYFKDTNIQKKGITLEQVIEKTVESYNRDANSYAGAQIADTGDRVIGVAGLVFDMTGIGYIVCRGLEIYVKSQFYNNAPKGHKFKNIATGFVEVGSSMAPVWGNVFDILMNMYMANTRSSIRDDAKKAVYEITNEPKQTYKKSTTAEIVDAEFEDLPPR